MVDGALKMFGSRQKTVIEFVFAQSGAAGFYLSGGTALSAYYLNHRDSDDLDFFSEHDWVTIAEFQPVSIVRVDTDFFNRLVYSHQVTSSDGAFQNVSLAFIWPVRQPVALVSLPKSGELVLVTGFA